MNEDVNTHTDPLSGEVYIEGMSPTRLRTDDYMPTPTPSAARPYRPAVPAGDGDAAVDGKARAGGEEAEAGVMNAKALSVIARVEAKLLGKDFDVVVRDGGAGLAAGAGGEAAAGGVLDVRSQVDRLIVEATSHVNLCQLYVGWCSFW